MDRITLCFVSNTICYSGCTLCFLAILSESISVYARHGLASWGSKFCTELGQLKILLAGAHAHSIYSILSRKSALLHLPSLAHPTPPLSPSSHLCVSLVKLCSPDELYQSLKIFINRYFLPWASGPDERLTLWRFNIRALRLMSCWRRLHSYKACHMRCVPRFVA